MDKLETRINDNAARISKVESDVNDIKVEVGKMAVTIQHESSAQTERFENIKTQNIELKELMKARMERDEQREREAREYREKRELAEQEKEMNRQKWVQSLLTPQTVVVIVVIILSALGIKVSETDFSGAVAPKAEGHSDSIGE